ncbi:MAG: hypothetical protein GY854_11410 [Deltaproteobacteria bacterium]|nr:hypothetical protein [Deltaproteobacteria bacterium]
MRQFSKGSNGKKIVDLLRLGKRNTPPLLFLGAGCGVSAGLPTGNMLAKKIYSNIECNEELDSLASLKGKLGQNHLHDAIEDILDLERDTSAYDMLACLIAEGYFETVLTTNWDDLLETSLSRLLTPRDFRVFVRRDENEEQIKQILNKKRPKCKIIKLHGDTLYGVDIAQKHLMSFSEELTEVIKNKIEMCGLILVGYGLNEPGFSDVIPQNPDTSKPPDNIYYVAPSPPQTNTILESLVVRDENTVNGDDGRFENFVQGLCKELLGKPHIDWWKPEQSNNDDPAEIGSTRINEVERKSITDAVQHIQERKDSSIRKEAEVLALLEELKQKLDNEFADKLRQGGKGVCLVFIHDPSAPGGFELKKQIEVDPEMESRFAGYVLESVQVTDRIGRDGDARKVVKWKRLGKELKEYGAVILVDSVSFTGNTLNIVREAIVEKEEVDEDRLGIALLLLPSNTKILLEKCNWKKIVFTQEYSGYEVFFPWGWTRATKPIPPQEEESDFHPAGRFGYTPKPWGDRLSFVDNNNVSVGILMLERGQRTSFHYHLLRDEVFFVLDYRIRILIWNKYIDLERHGSIRIPAGVPHSIIALDHPCRVLEIVEGHHDQGKDIIRLEDLYNREKDEDGMDDGYK